MGLVLSQPSCQMDPEQAPRLSNRGPIRNRILFPRAASPSDQPHLAPQPTPGISRPLQLTGTSLQSFSAVPSIWFLSLRLHLVLSSCHNLLSHLSPSSFVREESEVSAQEHQSCGMQVKMSTPKKLTCR